MPDSWQPDKLREMAGYAAFDAETVVRRQRPVHVPDHSLYVMRVEKGRREPHDGVGVPCGNHLSRESPKVPTGLQCSTRE